MTLTNSTQLTNIRGVIIDLDGTMVHTAPDFQEAINLMREEFKLAPLSIETVIEFVGKGSEHLIQNILHVGLDKQTAKKHFDLALERYQHHYFTVNGKHSHVYNGVVEGLNKMREMGLRLACVTNKPHRFAVTLLEKTGLHDYFEVIYGGDSFSRKKPDPLPMLTVCRDFSLEPSQVLAIGDSSNDAQAARAAGCKVFAVPYGYNHGQPVQSIDSDGIVDSLFIAANRLAV
jgi:phosphoglycolate phosphatase